jgi:mono/diheme cytochrome c family protein
MKSIVTIFVGVIALGVALYILILPNFFSARGAPRSFETWAVMRLRHLAIPKEVRDQQNPIQSTDEVLTQAREHFADHCASCHGNDGRGKTEMGPNFYPPVPDMTKDETQSLTDGEIYYAIQNGVRFTGMPAWGTDSPEDVEASWKLVHFIRHLPKISRKEIGEMEKLNPKSPAEMEDENEAERFLDQGEAQPHHHTH